MERRSTSQERVSLETVGSSGAMALRSTLPQSISSISALLLICIPFTLGAIRAFPIIDDGWFWLLIKEQGVGEIVSGFPDRPVWGHLLSFLAPSEDVIWFAAFVAQALLWPALGLISALLWARLFPHLTQYAFVVACLAVAPFTTNSLPMVTASFALGPLVSVTLAYGALLALLHFIRADQRWSKISLALSAVLFAISTILTEYAVPVALIAIILVLAQAWQTRDHTYRTRAYVATLTTIAVVMATYMLYIWIADRSSRPDVHPGMIFTQSYWLEYKIPFKIPFRLAESTWRGAMGGLLASLAQLHLGSWPDLLKAAYGALVAGLLVYGSRSRQQVPISTSNVKRHLLVLTAALLISSIPILLMDRMPWDDEGWFSRFGVPLLPVAAMLTVYLGIQLVQPRFWFVPIMLFGFAAGYLTLSEVRSASSERRIMAEIGARLQPYVSSSDSLTVAVVAFPERPMGGRYSWELTARLTSQWPPAQREHFWAYDHEQAYRKLGNRLRCNTPMEVDVNLRGVVRAGPVRQVLWVAQHPNGSITIEPYCITN